MHYKSERQVSEQQLDSVPNYKYASKDFTKELKGKIV
jgi:hypothetical protein